jgi:ferredoxin-NADP reductase
MTDTRLQVRVHQLDEVAPGVAGAARILDLRPVDGGQLPPFSAGAHIDVHAGPELVRQYSLLNDPAETHRYVVAVALDADSRGGSRWIHDWIEPNDTLTISAPRCHFHLIEDAPHSVLIAGGIGVTPLWAMAQRLITLGRSFELHYGARSKATAPLLGDISTAMHGRKYVFQSRFEDSEGRLDLTQIVTQAPAGSHFYACGPSGMLEAYLSAASGVPTEQVHYERFASTVEVASEGGFTVELARRQMTIEVVAGQTILEALKEAGINAPHSCAEGICGACETMMICCSGAKTSTLVLDL